jgi:hypothetical protein
MLPIHWYAGAILHVAPALSALGILCPQDPSVPLIFILGSISYGFMG